MMSAVKTALKILSLIGLIIAVIISVFGFIAVMDAQEFKEKISSEPNLFLLVEGGKILAGARDMMHEGNPESVKTEEIAAYQDLLDNEDYKSLVGKNYKVFIVHMRTFDAVPEGDIGDAGFGKKEAVESLRSENSREWFIDYAMEKAEIPEGMEAQARKQIEENSPSEGEIRTTMFMVLLSALSEQEGSAFMIKEHQNENIDVYPETMLFRFIDIVPQSAVERMESRIA
jgi:hypothetical protein